jgi:hypothetical protein
MIAANPKGSRLLGSQTVAPRERQRIRAQVMRGSQVYNATAWVTNAGPHSSL